MRRFSIIAMMLILVSTTFIGCGGSGGGTGTGTGNINLYLTDAPANLKEVNVRITQVSVSQSSNPNAPENGWLILNSNPVDVNLLNLRFDQQLLGASSLPAGAYHQLRLVIESASLKFNDGSTAPLTIPSAEQSGIKIKLNKVTVPSGGTADILMDVNVADFIDDGSGSGYKMRSTAIKVASINQAGKISGKVTDPDGNAITGVDVIINVKQGTTTIASTYALKEDLNGTPAGSFIVNNLEPGEYTVEISAQGYTTITFIATVQAGQTTDVGTKTF